MIILANDGIAEDGKKLLEQAGYEVITAKIAQEDLKDKINDYDVLIVRSATKVNKEILNNANRLKLVVRAGVGTDNIDLVSAKENNIDVLNTPQSSSLSVAELVFAHIFTLARFTHLSGKELNASGKELFNELKKKYSDGFELRGKTLGVVGFGRIGQEVTKIGISLGMEVLIYNHHEKHTRLHFDHLPFRPVPVLDIRISPLEEVLAKSDIISLHIPHREGMPAVIDESALLRMKDGAYIVNTARGGVIDEMALVAAINSGKIAGAAIDVFEGEPIINKELLNHPKISLTPHIGASTKEAQKRISKEVAEVIINKFKA